MEEEVEVVVEEKMEVVVEEEEEEEKYEPDLDLEADFPQGKRLLHPPAVCNVKCLMSTNRRDDGKFCETALQPAFLL